MKTENTGTTGTMRADTVRLWPGVMLGLLLAGIAFALSFDALRVVFAQSGTNPVLSWGGPLCVDGTILLSTWATWGFKKGGIRGQAYPWAGFCLFSLLSIAGNILHAWLAGGGNLPQWAAMAVMAVPPCALMYSTHLIVIIAGDWHDKHAPAAISTASDPGAGAEPHGQSGERQTPAPGATNDSGTAPPAFPTPPARSLADIPAPRHPDATLWRNTPPVPAPPANRDDPDTETDGRPEANETCPPRTATIQTDAAAGGETEATGPIEEIPSGPAPAGGKDGLGDATGHETDIDRAVDGGPDEDQTWLDWARRLKDAGQRPTAPRAYRDGVASSVSTAKRHLARLRAAHPGEF